MKDYAEKKIGRLERIFPNNAEIAVAFSATRADNKVEISGVFYKRAIRAEVVASDMYAAIDAAVDKLDKQLVKHKSRLKDKSRKDGSFKDEFKMLDSLASPEDDSTAEEGIIIERRKHFPLKPIDPEEAVMEMELLGHTFFVFRNSSTDEINVVYKRHNNTYGLIDPNDPFDYED
jgi:putative sigma-54 modulation protein